MASILVLHGPNLNLLGTREPEHYGRTTLDSINTELSSTAAAAGHQLVAMQSNAEFQLIERIHQAHIDGVNYIIINAGAPFFSVKICYQRMDNIIKFFR